MIAVYTDHIANIFRRVFIESFDRNIVGLGPVFASHVIEDWNMAQTAKQTRTRRLQLIHNAHYFTSHVDTEATGIS